jgi:hypothetical protein
VSLRLLCPFCDEPVIETDALDYDAAAIEGACSKHLRDRHPVRCRVIPRVRRAVMRHAALREAERLMFALRDVAEFPTYAEFDPAWHLAEVRRIARDAANGRLS